MEPIAVVTGGTRGIGFAISRTLCRNGYRVAAVYRENEVAAERLRAACSDDAGSVSTHRVDLTDQSACAAFADEFVGSHIAPVVLVNNAGAIPYPAHWREQPIQTASQTVTNNLLLTMNVTWAFAPAMASAGRGSIVNISSTYAFLGDPEVLSYTAAKAGVHALTRGLARDLGSQGVRVNTISPAVVATEMTLSAGEAFIEDSIRRTPVGRLATGDDIAQAVLFVVDNAMVNGIDLIIDGGLHLVGP